MTDQSISGKVAFVTGAGRGIGPAAALAFAGAGCRVVATARSLAPVAVLAERIRGAGGEALPLTCDVTDQVSVEQAMDAARNQFGGVDILLNNAGVGGFGAMVEATPEAWQLALDVNLTGPFLCTRAAAPLMKAAGWGRILNITTGLTQLTLKRSGPYAVAKAGLEYYTRLVDAELAASGIRAIAFSPGTVQTDMYEEWIKVRAGGGPPAVPAAEIAPMMVYLCQTDRPIGGLVVTADEVRAWRKEK